MDNINHFFPNFDSSPPSSAKVKKIGAIPPLPHMSSWRSAYLIKHRDNFTFYLLLRLSEYNIEVHERKVNVFVVIPESLFRYLPEETYTISIKFSIKHVCLASNTL
jgi:hypothetical protein